MTPHQVRRNLMQAPDAVVMIRPRAFRSNPETLSDNNFQQPTCTGQADIAKQALCEFDKAVETLRGAGVKVHVFDDDGSRNAPD